MTCSEVRQYLFAFLDDELDAPMSIELQQHLDGCHNCARESEVERTIRKRLAATLEAALDIPAFTDSWGESRTGIDGTVPAIPPVGSPGSTKTLHPARTLAWAAVLIGALGVSVWFVVIRDRPAPGVSGFAGMLVADFEHFLDEGGRVQMVSADRLAVSDWLFDQTTLNVQLPAPQDPKCKLLGARKCKIAGKPAAFAAYEMHGVLASLVVVSATPTVLEGMEHVQLDGGSHWVSRLRGHTVVASRRDGQVYAAVSTLPVGELLCLMKDVNHEGN